MEELMGTKLSRRDVLKLAGVGLLPGSLTAAMGAQGLVTGQPEGARVGMQVLEEGGNAVDAAVAAALTAGVVAVHLCGIGGYGGHMVIARANGETTAIDFNSAAPAAARPDMFPLDEKGNVKGQVNMYGWLAAGVPGTMAGLQLAQDRYGTKPFARLVQPAIRYAREGFPVTAGFAGATKSALKRLRADPGSARLLLKDGEPLKTGETFRNPDLAGLLEKLAGRGSVESFYRGDIGEQIAAAFRKHGGLVTAEDMAGYQAKEVGVLELEWRGHVIRTAPLTAGGLTVLQAIDVLKRLDWDKLPGEDLEPWHARLETLRLVWGHRLRSFGDMKLPGPLDRLLWMDHRLAGRYAGMVREAVRQKRPIPVQTDGRSAGGTIHLSAADKAGNMAAITLTHGGSFGAQVAVERLGLILGHGMSRFDPRPDHPNSPGPAKRPLHNMCPTVVLKDNRPILALGGRGGRKIPNSVFAVLCAFVGRGASLEEAIAAPRLHTEGGLDITAEARVPKSVVDYLASIGYKVSTGPGAVVDAVFLDPATGFLRAASR
jgi:gamma-glutamyltranspeptidase/glutathione hydrolase